MRLCRAGTRRNRHTRKDRAPDEARACVTRGGCGAETVRLALQSVAIEKLGKSRVSLKRLMQNAADKHFRRERQRISYTLPHPKVRRTPSYP